jgi:hypothetical protein
MNRFAIALFALALSSTAAQAATLLEDCKYVSLNNSIRLAYGEPGVASVALSLKSYETHTSQIVVLDTFDSSGAPLGERGYEVTLSDPESGFCYLRTKTEADIKNLSAQEVSAIEVLPYYEGSDEYDNGKDLNRFWNECNVAATNRAFSEWNKLNPGVAPLVGYTSSRKGKTDREYVYILSSANTQLITANPNYYSAMVGEKKAASDVRISIKAEKNASNSCDIGAVTID